MTVFDNAISAALTTRRNLAGATVSYNDGTNPAASVSAVRGQPNVRLVDALVTQITERYVDWMILASSLSALAMPPKSGHTITVNGDEYTVARFEGQPEWSWVDSGETEYRIHTIKTGDA